MDYTNNIIGKGHYNWRIKMVDDPFYVTTELGTKPRPTKKLKFIFIWNIER